MGFLDRLFGTNDNDEYERVKQQATVVAQNRSQDEIAVERYRYLLRNASPDTIEAVHEEAFSKLTVEQRKILFAQLSADSRAGDAPQDETPRELAVAATRNEIRDPGSVERSLAAVDQPGRLGFNGAGGGLFGGGFASSMMGTIVGYVVASSLVHAFFPTDFGAAGGSTDVSADNSAGDTATDGAGASDAQTIDASGGYDSGMDGGFDGGGFDGGGMDGGGFGDFGDFGF